MAARRGPKHARPVAPWRRLLAPALSGALATALITCLLLFSGGPHGVASTPDRFVDASSQLGPLAPPVRLNAATGHSHSVRPLRFSVPPTTVVTRATPPTTVTTDPAPTATTAPPHVVTQAAVPTTTTTTSTTTTTTTTPSTPTTTPAPGLIASSNGSLPDAPSSLGIPTTVVLDDEFDTGTLNTALWSPTWYGNTQEQNDTVMSASNVAVDANGLELTAAASSTGAIVSSNPDDNQPGHTGFQIAPTPGSPVYVEFRADLPAASNGEVANWPALWLVGQSPWPENGEIDVMEGLEGSAAFHLHFGDADGEGADGPGSFVNTSPGVHTYGALWTTTSVTFVYDGVVVGTLDDSLTSPMHLVMENSIGSSLVTLPSTMTVRYVKVWQ
jgi:hypothetical protein